MRELAPHFPPGDPQIIVPVLAEQNGCLTLADTGTATPRVTGTPVAPPVS